MKEGKEVRSTQVFMEYAFYIFIRIFITFPIHVYTVNNSKSFIRLKYV
ncbi:hypothetical protein M5D96_012482 [Drosophila gunungcola]|uniref:Uncharacterized protein n=1 Tax=Drosophila gunungcola TaxID=103775 RepID=A0A9P9YD73_9MUSC|nr:hypothetical protein M5D96_012482 [Drosophila gunungcola]